MKRTAFLELISLSLLYLPYSKWGYSEGIQNKKKIKSNAWQPFETLDEKGLLGKRMHLWRNKRLWFVQDSGFLLSGFESRPGAHAWQGEHVGKWLHAATLACESTKDRKLKKVLDQTVERLLATQLPNGYMGTYSESKRFYNNPTDPKGWDVWTHRYNLYGLLTYEKYRPNKRAVEACQKMADLLIKAFGEGKADLTKYGTRQGISSTTLLESIIMLYERTENEKYLDFAEHIVTMSENNPGLRLMGTMLSNGSVIDPGDGKAYQLMANLLGYLRLYQCTSKEKYLKTVLKGWQKIKGSHLLVTGGPWSRKMSYNGNKECFAKTSAFDPYKVVVENCCTVTWIQLNIQLFEFTGQAKYANEAEKSLFNQLVIDQHQDGIDWCYYTKPNEFSLPYESDITCCASSGPRALEMFSRHLVGTTDHTLSINSFSPSIVALSDEFGGGSLKISGSFPFTSSSVKISFQPNQIKTFPIEFRPPSGTSLGQAKINGKRVPARENHRGFLQLTNKWNQGDVLTIDIDYQLKSHISEGTNAKKWIAFTYGPVALAQKIHKKLTDEPFKGLSSENPNTILSRLSKTSKGDSSITFVDKKTGTTLIPFAQAGSKEYGPRTYFKYT